MLYDNIKAIKDFYMINNKFVSFNANCSIESLHEQVLTEISPQIIVLVGDKDMKAK